LTLYLTSTWILPVLLAITFHEAAHAYAAYALGDDTAYRGGRLTLNPLKHIDLVGTVILPGLLLLMRAPFLFGYAKPVLVNFQGLRHPRRDMVLVAIAGPATNLALATLAAVGLRFGYLFPAGAADWLLRNLLNALAINVLLAVFNMLPILPLDGGRVLLGILPRSLAARFARLEPYGMAILLGLLFVLPFLGRQLGRNLDVLSWMIAAPSTAIRDLLVWATSAPG
jgi:Zn-dependent protease